MKKPVTKELVLEAAKERCARLSGRADLLQFHWQDWKDDDHLKVIEYLVALTETNPELVSEIGLINFDSATTERICKHMLEKMGRVGVVSNQVQFSLIDSRPLYGLSQVCEKYGLKLMTYGSYSGGFLSERWLDKQSPHLYARDTPLTPSQRKYLEMIQKWGTWEEFQQLLSCLKQIADKHKVDVSNVAARWLLQQPCVGIVIVGTRLGVSSNVESNVKTFGFTLDEEDLSKISKIATVEKGKALFDKVGDCGSEYR